MMIINFCKFMSMLIMHAPHMEVLVNNNIKIDKRHNESVVLILCNS